MIKEYEYLHGVVFNRLCSVRNIKLLIRPYKVSGYSSYIVNESVGLYIKYSGGRLAPWKFTFLKSHQEEVFELYKSYGEVFIALVCNLDGIAILNFEEIKAVLPDSFDQTEQIRVFRKRNSMYTVSSSSQERSFKVSKRSCPEKIVAYFKS